MHRLPSLVTSRGHSHLPLSELTAARLAAAWINSDESTPRKLLRTALTDDPALAVWTVTQFPPPANGQIPTCDELAAWLAASRWSLFNTQGNDPPAEEILAEIPAECAQAAGLGRVVAQLAWQLARGVRLDAEQACVLGLIHLAPAWLRFSGTRCAADALGPLLPAWMVHALNPIGGRHAVPPRSIADCVAHAIALANSEDEALYEHHGLDPKPWIGQAARWAKAWSSPGPWASALPALAQRLARLEELETDFARTLETEKLESLKELAYGAGHEINNPLANISARAQTLLPGERDPDRRRLLAAINTQAFRAHEMIADMMLFARPPAPQLAEVELSGLLEKLVAELAGQATAQQTDLVLDVGRERQNVAADATQLLVAIRAVCVNALEALVRGGRLEIRLRESPESRSMTQIDITDTGPGIPENVRRHLFDPFYSGREAGRGLGFGLSKCWRIVTMHGGRVDVAERPGGGTVFIIALPNCNNR